MAPVSIKVKKQQIDVAVDEHPRPQTKIEDLQKLSSIFQKNGLVTAGSASVSLNKIIKKILTIKNICFDLSY